MLVDAVDFSTVRNIIEFFPPDFFHVKSHG